MNIFLVVDRGDGPRLLTPALTGSFLPGITRRSIIELAPELGIPVEETRISVDDWRRMAEDGELIEAFACGTAAVVAAIGKVRSNEGEWTIGTGREGAVVRKIRDRIIGIQRGTAVDTFGWVEEVLPPSN